MIHTCGTSMTNFIFVHALPKENVDWLPWCEWVIFISDSDSDSLFSNPKYIHNLLYIYINICINTGYNYFMYILWLPRGHIALGCLPVTPQ